MRVLVTGANGQLGTELANLYAGRDGDEVLGVDLPNVDITDQESVAAAFRVFSPDVVINCAAWTAVDAAEEERRRRLRRATPTDLESSPKRAVTRVWLVQISTDYVFSGDATSPYAEDAEPDPRSAYGRTKLAGELAVQQELPDAHYIVRTAWLYGHEGSNFVKTMLRLETEHDTVDVVDDQVGQPTYAADLAAQIAALVDARPAAGIFHGTNSGTVSWNGFTREIFRLTGADPERVHAVTSEQFVRPAPRPAYSVLGHARWADIGLAPMRDWRSAIADALRRGMV